MNELTMGSGVGEGVGSG